MAYKIQRIIQQKQITAGMGLIDVTHVDFMTENGMLYFVDVPLAESSKENIDAVIRKKIAAMDDILSLGK